MRLGLISVGRASACGSGLPSPPLPGGEWEWSAPDHRPIPIGCRGPKERISPEVMGEVQKSAHAPAHENGSLSPMLTRRRRWRLPNYSERGQAFERLDVGDLRIRQVEVLKRGQAFERLDVGDLRAPQVKRMDVAC